MTRPPVRVAVAALVVSAGLTAVTGRPAAADHTASWTVRSPGGDVTAELRLDDDGSLGLTVGAGGTTALASPLGITTGETSYTSGLTLVGREHVRVDETYETVVGKRRHHRAVGSRDTFWFVTADGARLGVEVYAADDGIAYRYFLPGTGPVTVTGESSGFAPPADTTGWLSPYSNSYASRPFETEVASAPEQEYGYPALLRTPAGTYVLLTEADVDGRYDATRLALDDGAFHVRPADPEVVSERPLRTPWRVAIVGDLADVVESDLVHDLAPASRVRDAGWVRPGVAAWSWWSDSASPHSLPRQKQYVDYAQRHGWEYVLVDEGWDPAWIRELIRYADVRGIGVWVWSHWQDLATQEQRDELLARWKSWGAVGVKVDFMNSDSQARMQWYDAFLRDTARPRLMVNFHGATLPRGIERTWPHVVTVEAVAGAGLYKIDPSRIGPDVNATYPFTRNVVGSVDYTPVTFSTPYRDTSDGHELALSVVLESGLQHFADSPESYASRPLAEDWLDAVPTVWDQTRLLSGEPGEAAVIARRAGPEWYVGGLVAGAARALPVDLDFLGGRAYLAEVFEDAADGGLHRTREVVDRDDVLRIPVTRDGGFAARICPYSPGLDTCGRRGADGDMAAEPDALLTRPGRSFEVAATFKAPTDGPVRDVRLDAVAPDGWPTVLVSGRPHVDKVDAGATVRARWRIAVPADAELGTHEVVTRARFRMTDTPANDAQRLTVDATEVVAPPPGFYDVTTKATERLTATWVYGDATAGFVEYRPIGTEDWQRVDATFDGVRYRAVVGPFDHGLVDLEYRLAAVRADGSVDRTEPQPAQLIHPDAVTVVNNEDPGYQQTGPWQGSSLTGWDGSRTAYTTSRDATATWQADLAPGLYDVAVWFPADSGNTRSATYEIAHAGGTTTRTVDQLEAGGSWHSLGRYRATADGRITVTLRVTSGGFTRVDATRFVKVTD